MTLEEKDELIFVKKPCGIIFIAPRRFVRIRTKEDWKINYAIQRLNEKIINMLYFSYEENKP